ncbi:MAG: hypothetical protein IJT68_07830, partial [Lentisphaeria bacterium]|nr:hypothetical protein [Lentisphaeria bacterium]
VDACGDDRFGALLFLFHLGAGGLRLLFRLEVRLADHCFGDAFRGFGGGQPGMGGQQGPRSSVNTIADIQTKFPEEYKEAQKLRQTDPAAYRAKLRELQGKLTDAN